MASIHFQNKISYRFCILIVILSLIRESMLYVQPIYVSDLNGPKPRLTEADYSSYNLRDHEGPGTYAFGYDVEDAKTGNTQFREEERHPNGTVTGSYGYVQPDGNVQVVHYVADQWGYRVRIENSRDNNQPPKILPKDPVKVSTTSGRIPAIVAVTQRPIYTQNRPIYNRPIVATNVYNNGRFPNSPIVAISNDLSPPFYSNRPVTPNPSPFLELPAREYNTFSNSPSRYPVTSRPWDLQQLPYVIKVVNGSPQKVYYVPNDHHYRQNV